MAGESARMPSETAAVAQQSKSLLSAAQTVWGPYRALVILPNSRCNSQPTHLAACPQKNPKACCSSETKSMTFQRTKSFLVECLPFYNRGNEATDFPPQLLTLKLTFSRAGTGKRRTRVTDETGGKDGVRRRQRKDSNMYRRRRRRCGLLLSVPGRIKLRLSDSQGQGQEREVRSLLSVAITKAPISTSRCNGRPCPVRASMKKCAFQRALQHVE
jgi:hypothetical protein